MAKARGKTKTVEKLVTFPIELEEIPFPFSSDRSKSVVNPKCTPNSVEVSRLRILYFYTVLQNA